MDVELVLAVDVSASIDGGEVDLQRAGYVAGADRPARAIAAMLSGPLGPGGGDLCGVVGDTAAGGGRLAR